MQERELIKDLSEGYSAQSQTANRFWVLLIVASIVTLTGRAEKDSGLIELPFTLGKVSIIDFYSIMIILISVLSIAFASAMIQAIRARKLIQNVIDSIPELNRYIGGIHIQDIVDVTLKPTFNRVAPIAQYLHGKDQFFDGKKKPGTKIVAVVVYTFLKVITFIFIYLIPFYSINKGLTAINSESAGTSFIFPKFLLIILIALAILSSLILFFGDLKYLVRVNNRIRK